MTVPAALTALWLGWQCACPFNGRDTQVSDGDEGVRSMLGLGSNRTTTAPDDMCVVVPAHNEELLLARCIRSVLTAGIAPHHVYVVDDGSADATAAAAA